MFQMQKYLLNTTGQLFSRLEAKGKKGGETFPTPISLSWQKFREEHKLLQQKSEILAVNCSLQRALTIPAVPHPEIQEAPEGATQSKSTLGI